MSAPSPSSVAVPPNSFARANSFDSMSQSSAEREGGARASNENSTSTFECGDCERSFDSSRALRIHVAQHKWGPHRVFSDKEGTKFQCLFEGCGKVVRDRKVLRKHCLTHKPREFACEECGKRFYERAKLKRHMLVHSGEKEFACSFDNCDKRFAYKANLLTHLRTHTGHRPFKCSWPGCGKTFAQASNRNSHVQTHSQHKRKRSFAADLDLKSSTQAPPQLEMAEAAASVMSLAPSSTTSSVNAPSPAGSDGAGTKSSTKRLCTGSPASPQQAALAQVRLLPTSPSLESRGDSTESRNMTISPSHRDTLAVNAMLSLGEDFGLSAVGSARPANATLLQGSSGKAPKGRAGTDLVPDAGQRGSGSRRSSLSRRMPASGAALAQLLGNGSQLGVKTGAPQLDGAAAHLREQQDPSESIFQLLRQQQREASVGYLGSSQPWLSGSSGTPSYQTSPLLLHALLGIGAGQAGGASAVPTQTSVILQALINGLSPGGAQGSHRAAASPFPANDSETKSISGTDGSLLKPVPRRRPVNSASEM